MSILVIIVIIRKRNKILTRFEAYEELANGKTKTQLNEEKKKKT